MGAAAIALPAHRAWEVWTMNGFHIVDARDPVSPVEHRYEIVQGRDGPRHPVTVRFAPRVVEAVAAEGGRALAADRHFWMRQGGLALAHYVWAQAGPPPDGRLEVEQVTGETAARGGRGAPAPERVVSPRRRRGADSGRRPRSPACPAPAPRCAGPGRAAEAPRDRGCGAGARRSGWRRCVVRSRRGRRRRRRPAGCAFRCAARGRS